MKASDVDLLRWEESIEENLVAIDRRGSPIYDVITPRALPELSESMTLKLAGTVKAAVERYYAANVVVGELFNRSCCILLLPQVSKCSVVR